MIKTYLTVLGGAAVQVATVATSPSIEVLLTVIAGEIVLVLVVIGVLRREGVKVADARSLEPDSPLGRHEASDRAHEAMRELLNDRWDARMESMRAEFAALRADTIHPLTEAMKEMAVTTRRAVDENARTVDLLAARMEADKLLHVRRGPRT